MDEGEKAKRLKEIEAKLWEIAARYQSGDDTEVGNLQNEALSLGKKMQIVWVPATSRYTLSFEK